MQECLKCDGVVAIATLGPDGQHMVNTWNQYIRFSEDGRMLIPAGGMQRTEANLAVNDQVLVTLGSSKVAGFHAPGTGFLIKGSAAMITEGPEFEGVAKRFAWARAVLAIRIESATQTL
jgi:hypothetical protein